MGIFNRLARRGVAAVTKRRRLILVALVGLIATLTPNAVSAGATPGPKSEPTTAMETALGDLQGRIAVDFADHFAGLTMDRASGKATLGVTGDPATDGPAMLRGFRYASSVQTVQRTYSLASLQQWVDRVTADLPVLNAQGIYFATIGADIAANRVKLVTPNPDLATQTAILSRYPGAPMAFQQGDILKKAACTRSACSPLRGGLRITDASFLCSSGFEGTRGGKPIMYTAGHCFTNNSAVLHNNAPVGTVNARTWPADNTSGTTDADGEYIPELATVSGIGAIYYSSSDLAYPLYNVGGRVGVKDPATEVVGTGMCRSGITTGTLCGSLTAVGFTMQVGNGDSAHPNAVVTVTNAREANTCSLPGDSGGPVFGGNLGYGVVTAGNFVMNGSTPACAAAPRTYYAPLARLTGRFDASVKVMG